MKVVVGLIISAALGRISEPLNQGLLFKPSFNLPSCSL